MLAGESMISSNMTMSAFYRTQKLRFNVPQTFLCLIILNKIGLPPAIGKHMPIQMKPSTHDTSFSPFNNRVIYLDFLFNGSTFQHLKVSRHIISLSISFTCILEFKSPH